MVSKGKACRVCRAIVENEKECPMCHSTSFTTFWKGYVEILDPEKSEIAKKMGIKQAGKHALRLSR